jgi:translation initiation factor eIF-2B subunit beta
LVVELFLKAAARKRRFFVIVAEGGPLLEGHKLAASLAKVHNIAVTLVPDSNVYPLMARVNKVVLSPHAVLADGGIIAPSGCEMVAIAAKDHSVPLVCLATTFELSPVFAHNHREVLSLLLSPSLVIDYNAAAVNANVEAIVAAYDYVPPLLIDTYITNSGTHQPSYIYRLLGEYYHPADTLEDA